MADATHKFLDPKVLNKITRLDLKARHIVEGFMGGMHKSPYHGFSVEFAEHREYAPGDDLKHLDWKVFGRTDRLYIKEYELETNLRSHILIDTTESMDSETWILKQNHFQIEVMANLDKVPATGAVIVVTWPKVENGFGFPARAFAILP